MILILLYIVKHKQMPETLILLFLLLLFVFKKSEGTVNKFI